MSVTANIQDKTTKNQQYIKKMAPSADLLSECLRQQNPSAEGEEERKNHGGTSPCKACATNRQKKWLISRKHTNEWLEKAGLKESTEALIVEAQGLSTRQIDAGVQQDQRCRLCKVTHGETTKWGAGYRQVRHTWSPTTKWLSQYTGRSGSEYGLEVQGSKWTPAKVMVKIQDKILWDFQIQTSKMLMAT